MKKSHFFILLALLSLILCSTAIPTVFAAEEANFNSEGILEALQTSQGKQQARIDGNWYTIQSSARVTLCGEQADKVIISEYKGSQVNFILQGTESEEIVQLDILCE